MDIFTAIEKATYVWRSNVKGYVHTPLRERNPLFAEMSARVTPAGRVSSSTSDDAWR